MSFQRGFGEVSFNGKSLGIPVDLVRNDQPPMRYMHVDSVGAIKRREMLLEAIRNGKPVEPPSLGVPLFYSTIQVAADVIQGKGVLREKTR